MMKLFKTFVTLCLVSAVWLSCDSDPLKNTDPESVSHVTGIWFGKSNEEIYWAYNLRGDQTAICYAYSSEKFETVMFESTAKTFDYPSWKISGNAIYIDGKNSTFTFDGNKLSSRDGSGRYFKLSRLYTPGADFGLLSVPELEDKTWTGYYKDKVITLEFHPDQTMTRTDKPNAGWEGQAVTKKYTWSISDKVIRLSDGGASKPYGIGLKEGAIFIDFGDVCSGFRYK